MMVDFLKKQGYLFICLGLLALLVVALFWALSIGTVKLSLVNIYNTVVEQLFSGQPIEGVDRGPVHDIVWLLRLPRLVLAALVGMGLSVCGVIMQAVVKNPSCWHTKKESWWVFPPVLHWVRRQRFCWESA